MYTLLKQTLLGRTRPRRRNEVLMENHSPFIDEIAPIYREIESGDFTEFRYLIETSIEEENYYLDFKGVMMRILYYDLPDYFDYMYNHYFQPPIDDMDYMMESLESDAPGYNLVSARLLRLGHQLPGQYAYRPQNHYHLVRMGIQLLIMGKMKKLPIELRKRVCLMIST